MGKLDPTRTQTIRVQYTRGLVRLFNRFRVTVTPSLKTILEHERNPYKSAELLIDSDLYNQVETPAPVVIRKNLRLAYRRGLHMAEGQLKRLQDPFNLLDEEALALLEENNLVLVKSVSADVKKVMLTRLTEGVSNGWGIDKITRSMVDPINGIGKHRATLIARTEIIRACNTAAMNRYQRDGIEMYEWISAVDERACEECSRLDGEIFRWGEHDVPPLHPQCRCSIAPYIER